MMNLRRLQVARKKAEFYLQFDVAHNCTFVNYDRFGVQMFLKNSLGRTNQAFIVHIGLNQILELSFLIQI